METGKGMLALLCPKCKHVLESRPNGFTCSVCREVFSSQGGIVSFFNSNSNPNSFASLEAKAHDDSAKVSNEFMGSELYYNEKLHAFIYEQVAKLLSHGQRILEIGSGVGKDIVALAQRQYRDLHASDVSLNSIIHAKLLAEQKDVMDRISFYHFDGSYLPFKDKEFDAIFMVAALHHFSAVAETLKEIKRCCKTGGYVMAFIEPNRLYYRCVRPIAKVVEALFSPFRCNREITRSIAEETAAGFSISAFHELAKEAGLEVVTIQSHWVLTGFVYLFQQFCFRIFGRNCHFLLNHISMATCFIDDHLTRQKRSLCWHYSVIYRVT